MQSRGYITVGSTHSVVVPPPRCPGREGSVSDLQRQSAADPIAVTHATYQRSTAAVSRSPLSAVHIVGLHLYSCRLTNIQQEMARPQAVFRVSTIVSASHHKGYDRESAQWGGGAGMHGLLRANPQTEKETKHCRELNRTLKSPTLYSSSGLSIVPISASQQRQHHDGSRHGSARCHSG